MDFNNPISRRSALTKGALGASALIAGCTGDGGSGDGGSGDGGSGDGGSGDASWPPAGGRVEIGNVEPAGASHYYYNLVLTEHLPDHMQNGDELDFNLQALEGGGGLTVANYTANAPPDGSFIGHTLVNALLNQIIFSPDLVEYEYDDFVYPARGRMGSRCVNLNHRTLDIDSPFEMEWNEFIDQAEDLNYGLLGEGHGSTSAARAIGLMHPDLDLSAMEENFIMFPGGAQARAAFERGEVDVYLGSFEAQWGRREYYKPSFVLAQGPDSYIEAINNLTTTQENVEAKSLRDTDFDQEAMDFITAITAETWFWFLPPGTPDEIHDIWVDAFDQILTSDDFKNELAGQIVSEEMLDLYWQPDTGHDTVFSDVIEPEWQARQNNLEDFQALVGGGD